MTASPLRAAEPAPALPPLRNDLAGASSPYLRQHAANPVAWQRWGAAAFERAALEGKPVFLSIGYAACHWCHVMEHESFEDADIAAALNRDFIPIKVDRETHPAVDRIYMAYQQATQGGGGWPLSVWLTPERDPFFSGTYFPPDQFRAVLTRVAAVWAQEGAAIRADAPRFARHLAAQSAGAGEGKAAILTSDLAAWARPQAARAVQQLSGSFDERHAGWGSGTKFPQAPVLSFLLAFSSDAEQPDDLRARARAMAEKTLQAIARGGIRDHLGGGFHRYAVDREWRVPHFEKMLYDQAQLIDCYVRSASLQAAGADAGRIPALHAIAYVLRDLSVGQAAGLSGEPAARAAAFAASEDADSLPHAGAEEAVEGAFYVWTTKEFDAALMGGDWAAEARKRFGVAKNGNVPPAADIRGELKSQNVLFLAKEHKDNQSEHSSVDAEMKWKEALLAARNDRPRPSRDDKVIAAWNGMMISALCRSFQAAGDPAHLERAQQAMRFILSELRVGDAAASKTALRRAWFRGAASDAPATAADYAHVIAALLDLYESDFDHRWLQEALALQGEMDAALWDGADGGGGCFDAPAADDLIARLKSFDDGAEPAANAVAARNLLRMSKMLGREDFAAKAAAIAAAAAADIERAPAGYCSLLEALGWADPAIPQVVIAGDRESPSVQAALRHLGALPGPRVVLLADGAAGQAWLAERAPAIAAMRPVDGRATLYLCRDFTCEAPESDPAKLRAALDAALGGGVRR